MWEKSTVGCTEILKNYKKNNLNDLIMTQLILPARVVQSNFSQALSLDLYLVKLANFMGIL